ncbi:MAG: Gfo/Idh/MocA family oxidoreductase, partial [Candidatus Dormibacteria bacterium]
ARVGASSEERLPRSELVAELHHTEHDTIRRMSGPITVEDSCYGQFDTSPDATVLLSTTWRSRPIPVAYARPFGKGRVFYCGLGESTSGWSHPDLQAFLYRGLRQAAGREERRSVGVGMLGFGAIGPEHTRAIRRVAGLELVGICDRSERRLAAALGEVPGTKTVTELEELLALPAMDVVVISTPPNTHGPLGLRALEAGKHLVIEKPFCLSGAEADRMLAAAERAGATLTVYQNRRWDPDYLALRRLVSEGAVGDIFHLEAFVGGFNHPCHFWHSDAAISGGVIYDWGSHYLDWILELLPSSVVRVSASHQNRVWHDVTNDDHFDLRLTFDDGAEAQFIHSDIAAARKPKWYILGTRGAVVGNWREASFSTRRPNGVSEEQLPVADLQCELHLLRPAGRGQSHDERIVLPAPPPEAFYRNLAGHLLADEPLAVAPESARRNIAVMEAATESAASGRPVELRV